MRRGGVAAGARRRSGGTSEPPPITGGLPATVHGIYRFGGTTIPYSNPSFNGFNLLLHAFGKVNNTGTLTLVEATYTGMKADIDTLDAAGRKVILSLGGAGNAAVVNNDTTAQNLVNGIVTAVNTWGFRGIDFDFEAAATYTADALRYVAAKLKAQFGANFIITCAPGINNPVYNALASTAPGWSHPTEGVIYSGILCDAIMPQFYDWQATDASRQTSIYNEINRLIGIGVPASRIVIGGGRPWASYLFYESPSKPNGGHHPKVYSDAFDVLASQGKTCRGIFQWASGHDQNPNGYSTVTTAGNMGDPGNPWLFRDIRLAPPPIPKINSLVESFDTKDTSKWVWGSLPTVSGGAAHFPANGYGTNSMLTSVAQYDLTGSAIAFHLSAVPSTTSGDGPFFAMTLYTGLAMGEATNWLRFFLYRDSLQPEWNAGTTTTLQYAGYNATSHRHLRIRHTGTNVVWESSPDQSTWTQMGATVPASSIGLDLSRVRVGILAGADAANTGTYDIAGIN